MNHFPDDFCSKLSTIGFSMKKTILDKNDIDKILSRMAIEILEQNLDTSTLFIVGIKKRGDVLAKRLVKKISATDGVTVDMAEIDITFYRDDVQLKAYKYVVQDETNFDINEKNVILVDDVLFTGRTIRAAIDVLIDAGRPRSIQLAILIDRGARELPIQPDYVGKSIHAEPEDDVAVYLKETDKEDKVIVSSSHDEQKSQHRKG